MNALPLTTALGFAILTAVVFGSIPKLIVLIASL